MLHNKFNVLKRIHFIGIGGIGMSGIAKLMYANDYTISGSDTSGNSIISELSALGIHVFKEHAAKNIKNVDVVVFSGAISSDNPELLVARSSNIPVLSRAEMLAELMRFKYGIAIAGTHGKTTTTSLIAHIFAAAGLDPTYVIGGILNSTNKNAVLGKSEYFVAEADESDASFLKLNPMLAVVTNIDMDHMETYSNSSEEQEQTFLEFLHRLPFYGSAILCGDDERVQKIMPKLSRAIITYGLLPYNDIYATDIASDGMKTTFTAIRKDIAPLKVTLNLPGSHNVLNTLAAIAIADICGIADAAKCEALSTFSGVARRFQVLGDYRVLDKGVTVVEDYGHHPTEIAVTMQSARLVFKSRRVVLVFQPHRYSRTQKLWDDFVKALDKADRVIVLDVYSGGEKQIDGVNGSILADSLSGKAISASEADLLDVLKQELLDGDVVFFQGAGSISRICHNIIYSFTKTIKED